MHQHCYTINLSIVKDMLGHAYESTTLKHYVYNIEDNEETENKVRKALGDQGAVKSDQSDQNIISFSNKIKAGTLNYQSFQPTNKNAEDGT